MNALEKLTKIPLATKLAALVALLAVGAVFYWFFYYDPSSQELDNLQRQHAKLKTDLADAQRAKSTYDRDQQRRDELKKTYADQLRALPAEAEMSSFLANLNSQAELVGLEIVSVQPKQEEAAQYYARIPVELQLTGLYHQLAKFFYLVGNLERVINIENIKLTVVEVDDGNALLKADVKATTFRSVEAAGG